MITLENTICWRSHDSMYKTDRKKISWETTDIARDTSIVVERVISIWGAIEEKLKVNTLQNISQY